MAMVLAAASEPMLADDTPSSSALIRAKSVHSTILNHWSSPLRTTGPNDSLLMRSGRMRWAAGSGRPRRMAWSQLAGAETALQRPEL